MSWSGPTHEQLLNMMDGHPPPDFPAGNKARKKLPDEQLLAMHHYWRVYDTRLEATFKEKAWRYRLIAGLVPGPWWTMHRALV